MSFLSDAENFMQSKEKQVKTPFFDREKLFSELKKEYQNASEKEINHALDLMEDKFDESSSEREITLFLKSHLED